MITQRMLDIYQQSYGDSTALVIGMLSGIPDKEAIAQNWHIMDQLMQSIILIRNGSASTGFAARIHAEIIACTDSADTARYAFEVAERIHPR